MSFVHLIPVFLSALLLCAHFLRSNDLVLVALCLLLPWLLLLRRPWVPRVFQVGLVLGSAVWLHTTYVLIQARIAMGEDWTRMAIILGSVGLITGGSALVFGSRRLARRYRLVSDPASS